jgi:hypothetical protein
VDLLAPKHLLVVLLIVLLVYAAVRGLRSGSDE